MFLSQPGLFRDTEPAGCRDVGEEAGRRNRLTPALPGKPADVPPTSWGPGSLRVASVPSKVQGPRMVASELSRERVHLSSRGSCRGPQPAALCPSALVRGASLLSPPTPKLISPGNALPDTPGNNVLPALWASFSPVRLTYKITHHNLFVC